MKKPLVINLALDSVLYAPLYVAVQRHHRRRSRFRFRFDCPRGKIEAAGSAKDPVRKLRYDPVFSPVIDKNYWNDPHLLNGIRNIWFAVGDPLRAIRLQENSPDDIRYSFVGSLVARAAFWAVVEVSDNHDVGSEPSQYNYVACHAVEMTGYHLAEHLLSKSKGFTPLAPVTPGEEVRHCYRLWRRDLERCKKRSEDSVRFAALTTEVGQAVYVQHCVTGLKRKSLSEWAKQALLPHDFLMTVIVRRQDEKNPDIIEAADELKQLTVEAIDDLVSQGAQFGPDLEEFYKEHPSFMSALGAEIIDGGYGSLVPKIWRGKQQELLREVLEELRKVYSASKGLKASAAARAGVKEIVKMAALSELKRAGESSKVASRRARDRGEQLDPANWIGAEELWR